MADDLTVLIDSFHKEVARAFQVPLHMLVPRVADEADMERFFTHHSNLMNPVVAGMKIRGRRRHQPTPDLHQEDRVGLDVRDRHLRQTVARIRST